MQLEFNPWYFQVVIDVIHYADWSFITGNPVKFGLGLLSVAFNIVFMLQHFVCYRKKDATSTKESYDNRGFA